MGRIEIYKRRRVSTPIASALALIALAIAGWMSWGHWDTPSESIVGKQPAPAIVAEPGETLKDAATRYLAEQQQQRQREQRAAPVPKPQRGVDLGALPPSYPAYDPGAHVPRHAVRDLSREPLKAGERITIGVQVAGAQQ